ncbi:MAG: ABC transporter ATP-binding protein [Pseudomonadota bacterium]
MLSAAKLSKSIGSTDILKNIDVALQENETVALTGPSGSGKTSLLHILGLLDRPTTGTVNILGADTKALTEKERTTLRRDSMGFVYQFHHLLPNFDALENVAMPLLIQGKNKQKAYVASENLLKEVGLGHRLHHKAHQLSGGEQQRVAIARAIIHQPKILLADEPTGNLDTKNSQHIFELLIDLARKRNMCALIATHNDVLAGQLDRVITLSA